MCEQYVQKERVTPLTSHKHAAKEDSNTDHVAPSSASLFTVSLGSGVIVSCL